MSTVTLEIQPQRVVIFVRQAHDLLLLDNRLHGLDLVAPLGGVLEAHIRCGLGHLALQVLDQIPGAAFEKVLEGARLRLVIVLGNRAHARPRAAVDVVFQARLVEEYFRVAPGAAAPATVVHQGAGAHLEDLLGHAHGLAHLARARERPEVGRFVALGGADFEQGRELLVERELKVRVPLVVLEPDVEVRLVHLDQVVFENQGFFLGARHDDLEVGDELDHLARKDRVPAILSEIRAHAAPQAARLADVDDLALGVLVQVHAGLLGQRAQLLAQRARLNQGRLLHRRGRGRSTCSLRFGRRGAGIGRDVGHGK